MVITGHRVDIHTPQVKFHSTALVDHQIPPAIKYRYQRSPHIPGDSYSLLYLPLLFTPAHKPARNFFPSLTLTPPPPLLRPQVSSCTEFSAYP